MSICKPDKPFLLIVWMYISGDIHSFRSYLHLLLGLPILVSSYLFKSNYIIDEMQNEKYISSAKYKKNM